MHDSYGHCNQYAVCILRPANAAVGIGRYLEIGLSLTEIAG